MSERYYFAALIVSGMILGALSNVTLAKYQVALSVTGLSMFVTAVALLIISLLAE